MPRAATATAPVQAKGGKANDVAEVAASVRFSVTRLARILRQQDVGGLSPSMISALAMVAREGPLTLGELASREHVAAPTVTRVVEKLHNASLVDRTVSPTDGRVVYVEATVEGRALIDEIRSRRTAWLASRLGGLSADELEAVRRAAPVLERLTAVSPEVEA